ncbi:MAG TPA: hypothetical protein VGI46_09975 [Candidatus Acidoferrum sp.]|jgi:hypothetical protein
MASERFDEIQVEISVKLGALRVTHDPGERRELLRDVRKLIADLESLAYDWPQENSKPKPEPT